MLSNYLNLEEKYLDRAIYRVFALQRLLELIATQKNTLVSPSLWDDPFENFILKTVGESIGKEAAQTFKNRFYGQCWSFHKDSDAMWRIYSPDKTGVRVRTTVRRLFKSLADTCHGNSNLSCFIGKVQYLPQYQLVQMLEDSGIMNARVLKRSSRELAATLLIKRKEFSHEREVRLIHFDDREDGDEKIFQYEVNPFELFDEIAFDPRISDELLKVFSSHLQRLGFKATIDRSPLYQLPQLRKRLATL
jgi:hypothetical protein